MITRIQVAAAALLSLLSSSGTTDRTLESFDLDAIPYADRVFQRTENFESLPSVKRSWRDVRDPLRWVGGRSEVLCAITEGSTARCWTMGQTIRETLTTTPWIRHDLLWESLGRWPYPWCVHNRADHSVECANVETARRDGPMRRWLTADTVFLFGTNVCARTGAGVTCMDDRHTIKFTLPSATASIEPYNESALCSRNGDRFECHWVSPRTMNEALDLSDGVVPRGRRGTTEGTRCEFVYEPVRRFVRVSDHYSAPWRSEAERRSLFLVVPDPRHPDRLEWRRIEEVFPPSARLSPTLDPPCDGASYLAWSFWRTLGRMGFRPDERFASSILGEERVRQYFTPTFQAPRFEPDGSFIPQSPPIEERMQRLFGMIE